MNQGDAIGLKLDLDKGTLEIYLNGVYLGVAVKPGMEGVAPLVGPLRWAVDVGAGQSVRIDGPQPDCWCNPCCSGNE